MKIFHSFSILIIAAMLITSCQQEPDFNAGTNNTGNPTGANGTFEAKINGQLTAFKVTSATLLRSTATSEKRLDITGLSSDSSKQLILTFGEPTAIGNAMSVKDYTVRLFNEDDPNTTDDESMDSDDGFTTYILKMGNSWVTDVYAENGVMKITACDANTKKVTGTFNVTDSSLTGGGVFQFTEGKFTNVTYMVLN